MTPRCRMLNPEAHVITALVKLYLPASRTDPEMILQTPGDAFKTSEIRREGKLEMTFQVLFANIYM